MNAARHVPHPSTFARACRADCHASKALRPPLSALATTAPQWQPGTTRPSRALFHPPCSRAFSSSVGLWKKKTKTAAADDNGPVKADKPSEAISVVEQEIDFTELRDELDRAAEKLKGALAKLRSGGRFNPQLVEALRVRPDKTDNASYPLRDLAQIVPRGGRELEVLVNDAAHVKPVTSAIQSSDLSLTPQPDPSGRNPQMLLLKIPPPTAESRKAVLNDASKAGDRAQMAVRTARGTQQKKFRKLELSRAARPDDLFRAHKEMEDIVKKAGEEVKKIVEGAKRALDT